MRHEIKKICKIVNEFMILGFSKHSENISINISHKDGTFSMIIQLDSINLSSNELLKLKKLLSVPRQNEVEEYYWQVMGEAECQCEFNLIGSMVDEVEVLQENDKLTIKLLRQT